MRRCYLRCLTRTVLNSREEEEASQAAHCNVSHGLGIGSAKIQYAQTWHQNCLSSVARYQPLQPEYVLAPYLSAVKGFKSRKLISRFRCGCHGLHVDTGRLLPLAQQVPREQRHCIFCASGSAEDEHHFVFDCPAYCAIRSKFTSMFWGPAPTLSSFFTT